MKKKFFFLMSLLFSCGFAWAQGEGTETTPSGVMVSGEISVKAGKLSYISLNSNSGRPDTVYLRKDGVEFKSLVDMYDEFKFENVPAGEYTLSFFTIVRSTIVISGTKTVTVGAENVEVKVEAVNDPSRVGLQIVPYYMEGYSEKNIGDVRVTCTKGEDVQTSYAMYYYEENWYGDLERKTAPAIFVCDTSGEYTISLHADGYKDTAFTLAKAGKLNKDDSVSYGQSIRVLMKEDLGNQVTLKGRVDLDGFSADAKLNGGLFLAVQWRDKFFTTEIKDTVYEIGNVPVGDVVYYLTTDGSARCMPVPRTGSLR